MILDPCQVCAEQSSAAIDMSTETEDSTTTVAIVMSLEDRSSNASFIRAATSSAHSNDNDQSTLS